MGVSGTSSFALPFDDLIDEALSRVGGEPMGGTDDGKLALRSFNLMMTDWQNRGVGLWTLETSIVSTTTSVNTITIGGDTLDVLGVVVRRSGVDTAMTRLSFEEYLEIPNKTQTGKPSQFFLDRQRAAPVFNLYMSPENSTDALVYWKVRFIQDAGKLANDPDLPRRFWPAAVSGLAYYVAQKRLALDDPTRLNTLTYMKMEYEGDLKRAMEEDRERTSVILRPKLRGGWR